ncbi:unnamed protein product [Mytilus coruscus]|uniref:Uncharacterized protein n=1 Tax=Mytilus coruscus TaxID=42192 RepID=A0A6J8DNX2_MYTCO|nr:unnamed protein product [Mytilus coruscus]
MVYKVENNQNVKSYKDSFQKITGYQHMRREMRSYTFVFLLAFCLVCMPKLDAAEGYAPRKCFPQIDCGFNRPPCVDECIRNGCSGIDAKFCKHHILIEKVSAFYHYLSRYFYYAQLQALVSLLAQMALSRFMLVLQALTCDIVVEIAREPEFALEKVFGLHLKLPFQYLDFAVQNTHSVEENWTQFKEAIETCIDRHIPKKKIGKHQDVPWMTIEIKRLLRKTQRLYNKSKKSKKSSHKEAFKNISSLIRNKLHKSY